ncbi:Transposon Tf2-9 polyprotein [Araneus ventricosus]|uniref:RNA-directed DNA polymerase n=1 Tax=Araneus ventricosus TaxID=182803 RepID=A0A4Y2DIM2_ARAVE|nr:Transposon Tf2-9 polyprotein [Araneus ventricosus]GBM16640.1 Transposon Tf2-9 polyprotein [Araneus ventricosus]
MAQSLISSLTPFKGGNENFDFFIKQFIEIAKLEKWGEAKKILVLKLNLKDEALKFLVSNPKLEEINHFDSLVKKLEEKFCKKPNFEEAQRQFNNLKQKVSQSISDLAEQVSSTTDKFSNPNNSEEENIINLTEKLKLSKFIEALRPDIRVEVKKLGPKNFKSAVAIAKNIDNALSDDGAEINVTDSGINQILSQQLSTNKQILELSEKVNAISSQNLCVNSLTEAPATNSNNDQSNQQSPCQICGKLNHKANNCFHYTRGNYYRGNVRANYNRTFRANNFHPYRSRANHRSNSGRGFRVGNQKFDFEENSPTNVCSETTDCDISESDKNKKESFEQINNNFGEKGNVSEETFHALNVKIANNITVQPFSTEIINLKVPKNIAKNKDLIFIPKKNKLGYLINESLNVPTNANLFHTIIENNTNKVIHVRKNTIMGKLSTFDVNDIMSPSESEIYQINNLNLNEIHKMRRDELLKSDFKLDHLNDKDKKDMQDLLLKNYKVFSKSYKTLGETSAVIPEFSLLHNFPLQTKPYSIPLMAKKYAQQEINNLLEAGRKIYCVLDLKSAFFQIKLRDEDKRKLAFCTEMGNFQPTRLPFGSKNSTSYFHTLISKCLNGITGKNVQFFLDDIIIAADSLCELKVTLQTVFDRLTKFNLTLDPAKLQLCKPEITYLGFDLNANGFSPSEQNVNKVTNFPRPKNLKQVQMFLGMLNYFRGLIYDYAGIVEPLVKLTKKNTPFVWSVECENAFNTVQEIILKKPTLKNFDPNLPISLITDASKIAICGILLQKKDNVYYPLEFFSRKLTPAECKYPSIRRELLAIYASVRHFHDQLLGEKFELLTDAKPLTEYQSLDKKPEIVARWLLYLGTFSFTPTHIPGSLNPADFLSRVVEENSLNVNNITLFQPNDKLSMQNISSEQKQDAILSKIMNDLSVNKQCKQYFLDVNSGLLMIKNALKNKKKIVNRIVIPKSLIKVCIETAHAPHFGVRKTFEFIRHKYQWKGMYLDTKNFCEHCEKCLENKPKAKLTQTQMIPKRNLAPGQCIAIDVVGKLPRSTDNKNFILTIIDHYSRYLEAYPLQNITSRTIINCLNKYFANFGLPKFLITDNATNFISNEMVEFLDRLNIQHRKSSIYYPMANGLLERAHRTMKESLASMCESTFQWSEKLLFFKLYYNNSIHSVTKFAPAEIFFGRKQNLPLDSFFEPITVENESKYLKNIRNNMCSIRNEFAKNEEQYFKNNAPHIKGRKVPNFNLGDKVFVKNFSHPHVFQEKYKGPFEIIKILRSNNYVIKSLKDNKTMKLNVSKIFKQEQPRPNLRN